MKTEKLSIEGMHCGHCTALVEKSLKMVKGVDYVSVQMGAATVSYDDAVTDRSAIEAAVTRFGYKIRD
ncbi:MAG: hypothetical protein Kow0025_01750 [Thermodesulfovibrionales bacterium]